MHLKIKSFNKKYLDIGTYKILSILNKKDQKFDYSIVSLPIKKTKYTFIKSPHKYNKSREAFEFRYYSKLIIIKKTDFNSELILKLRKSVPAGINIKIKLFN